MIAIKCSTPDNVKLSWLTPFQGDLKKRTAKEIDELAKSLLADGLLMPFAVWRDGDNNYLLDGHGRLAALTELALEDDTINSMFFPCVFIDAETEDEAKKALLQITSSYGKVTKAGAVHFTATIPEYHAPAINKYVHKSVRRANKLPERNADVCIRIKVPMDKEKAVRELLSQVEFIKVL